MNIVIKRRVAGIGFSPVAEGYVNFNTAGVLILLAVIGALLAWMDRWHSSPYGDALVGIVLVPLLIEVRNAFSFVPGQLVLGMVLLYAVVVASIWRAGSARQRPALPRRESPPREGGSFGTGSESAS
jgi:hypothetical protein